MSKLTLVQEGIFPIVADKSGSVIADGPKTGWKIAGTVQGEGKLIGVPSLFVRLAACNLRCIWTLPNGEISICDTAYASFQPDRPTDWLVDDVVAVIQQNCSHIQHVVISGGEPLMQSEPLGVLCRRLKEELHLHITIETNATLFDAEIARHVDLASLSPKLRSSEPNAQKVAEAGFHYGGTFTVHAKKRLNIEVIQQWIDAARLFNHDFQLKFVVGNANEEQEIRDEFLSKLHSVYPTDVVLMPLGANSVELSLTTPLVLEMAVRNGWRFTPRIHLDLFSSKMGV